MRIICQMKRSPNGAPATYWPEDLSANAKLGAPRIEIPIIRGKLYAIFAMGDRRFLYVNEILSEPGVGVGVDVVNWTNIFEFSMLTR